MISILSMPWGGTIDLDRMWTSAFQHATCPDDLELVLFIEWRDPMVEEYYAWQKSWMGRNNHQGISIIEGSSEEKDKKINAMKAMAIGPIYLLTEPDHRFTVNGWDSLMNYEWEMNKDFELN